MDKTQHKLAMEFFRSEIKRIAKRIATNKQALRHNQRIVSKKLDEPLMEYDKSFARYWYNAGDAIHSDKVWITALHIVYGELRGKPHVTEEKKKNYAHLLDNARKGMEEYIAQKQAALVPIGATSTGGL